tara:strand:- start:2572 stop:2766 length:195 start_codon:yes stop_codon:yes gene_type:complete
MTDLTRLTQGHRAAQITCDAAEKTYREAKRVYLMSRRDLLFWEAEQVVLDASCHSRDHIIGAEK